MGWSVQEYTTSSDSFLSICSRLLPTIKPTIEVWFICRRIFATTYLVTTRIVFRTRFFDTARVNEVTLELFRCIEEIDTELSKIEKWGRNNVLLLTLVSCSRNSCILVLLLEASRQLSLLLTWIL